MYQMICPDLEGVQAMEGINRHSILGLAHYPHVHDADGDGVVCE